MYYQRTLWAFRFSIMVVVWAACFSASPQAAELPQSNPLDRAVYHADPNHLWNRLHEALYIRVGLDGRAYGQDRLEPLLWSYSKHLLDGNAHERAVAVLQEFLKADGEKLIDDPLKRAVMQRDLWLVFNWLDGVHNGFALPLLSPQVVRAAVSRLRRPLAAVIGRLALSPEVIRDLPDNFEAAVASGQFARCFDAHEPGRPYLPPELFLADGPWVCVTRSDGPTAPRHLNENGTNRFTNSVFLVFLRLPGGRDDTVDFLSRLRTFGQPLMISNPDVLDRRSHPFAPNPSLPQFPKGTEVALVRRALLIDSSHQLALAPITESVQLRIVHGEVPSITPRVLDDATISSPARMNRVGSWQSFYEFRLTRRGLFGDRAGGLHFVGTDERDFKTGFNAHPYDVFERPLRADESFSASNRQPVIKQLCFGCHSLPGVYAFNSFQDFRSGISRDGDKLRPFPLSAMSVSEVAATAIEWKIGQPTWISLRKLLTE